MSRRDCHGGSGTIVDALSLGIPVVVLPMGADQVDNADRCEALGTNIALDPLTATLTEIADATRVAAAGLSSAIHPICPGRRGPPGAGAPAPLLGGMLTLATFPRL